MAAITQSGGKGKSGPAEVITIPGDTNYAVPFDKKRIITTTLTESIELSFNAIDAKAGTPVILKFNPSGFAPSFTSSFKKVGGSFVANMTNYVNMHFLTADEIHFEIYQI
jgi:hypothetical protein